MNTVTHNLVKQILSLDSSRPFRIGINGIDGSGKTHFTKSLATALRENTERQVITLSIDDFHNPKSIRYQKGRDSAEGFYRDSFQFSKLKELVLEPLKNQSAPSIITRIFDVRTDKHVTQKNIHVEKNAIVLVEGIFLFVPELESLFDFKIYLDVPFDITLERMLKRDAALYDDRESEIQLFHKRYKAGQELYIEEVNPVKISDVIINNANFNSPQLLKR